MKPDEDDKPEDFDMDAYKRGLEGDQDYFFPSEENVEGLKINAQREAEKEDDE